MLSQTLYIPVKLIHSFPCLQTQISPSICNPTLGNQRGDATFSLQSTLTIWHTSSRAPSSLKFKLSPYSRATQMGN